VLQAHLSYADGETPVKSVYFAEAFAEYGTNATYQDELRGWYHHSRPDYDTIGNVRSGCIGNPFAVPSPGALALFALAGVTSRRRRRHSAIIEFDQ